MKRVLYILLAAICITACDSDDEYVQEVFKPEALDGEWLLCDENNPQSATEVTFIAKGYSYRSTTYVDICNAPTLYEKYNGYYGYIKKTNSLRICALAENSLTQRIYDLEVKSVSAYTMLLTNKEYNSYDMYYRMVSKIDIAFGKTIGNSYLHECGFSANEFVSVNPNIASVDTNGNITAKGPGSTYIIAISGEEKVAVKVTVTSMVGKYAAWIYEATLDDITEQFGEPDRTGSVSETSVGLLYNSPSFDANLKVVQFNIDLETKRVTRILALYNSETEYLSDVSVVVKGYFAVEFGNIYYCDAEDFLDTRVHIYPFENGGNYYISYGSTFFFLTNWHY